MRKIIKEGDFIYKSPSIDNLDIEIDSLDELRKIKDSLTLQQYDGLYQNLHEVELWNELDWKNRVILCPILDYNSQTHQLIMPYIQPLIEEYDAIKISEDKCIDELFKLAGQRGASKEETEKFLLQLENLCKVTDLVKEDIIYNLSNIGYHDKFRLRIIDYGLSHELLEEEISV